MSKYDSREELRDKIDWEGGYADFFLGYGMSPDDAPDDETYAIVEDINKAAFAYNRELDRLRELLEMV